MIRAEEWDSGEWRVTSGENEEVSRDPCPVRGMRNHGSADHGGGKELSDAPGNVRQLLERIGMGKTRTLCQNRKGMRHPRCSCGSVSGPPACHRSADHAGGKN